MKRLYWLLALPYIVTSSTRTTVFYDVDVGKVRESVVVAHSINKTFECGEKTFCEDLAEALNRASESRLKKKTDEVWREIDRHNAPKKTFDFDRACGGSCGGE